MLNQPLHYLHKVNNRIHFPIDRSSRCSRVCLIVRDTRLLFLSCARSFLSLPSDIILKKKKEREKILLMMNCTDRMRRRRRTTAWTNTRSRRKIVRLRFSSHLISRLLLPSEYKNLFLLSPFPFFFLFFTAMRAELPADKPGGEENSYYSDLLNEAVFWLSSLP